jgi:addiction module HigA family antidote
MLREEFLEPLGITQAEFAERIGVSRVRLNEIVRGKRGITADTALRLAKALGTTPQFWLNGQANYDLAVARKTTKLGAVRVVNPAARRSA